MSNTTTIRINGHKLEAGANQPLLEIIENSKIDLPVFCTESNDSLPAIHTCLVEVRGEEGLLPACCLQVEDGMNIKTNTGLVRQQRREALKLAKEYYAKQCQQNEDDSSCQQVKKIEKYLQTGAADRRHPEPINYQIMNESIEIDRSLCIGCGKCVKACLQKEVGFLTMKGEGKKKVVEQNSNPSITCINCGQCTLECPVKAIREQSEVFRVERALRDPDKTVIVQMAPSIRTSIGEEFGMELGVNTAGKMNTAFRELGFDQVFDVNMGADITTLVEARALVEDLEKGGHDLPMFTSCCPSWVKFVEDYYPEFVSHLTPVDSPQIHAAGAYKTWWAERQGIDPEKIVVVSVMPCTSKKDEARLTGQKIDGLQLVDFVLTTRETAHLLKKNKINLPDLEESEVDELGHYSGAAAIYGASGGVMESALRTAAWMIEGRDLPKLEFEQVRGSQGIKKAELEIGGQKLKVAVVSTMRNARKILEEIKKNPEESYHCVEVMACPGGCIGGGGQPKPVTDEKIEKRIAGLYDIDQHAKMRKAHENQIAKDYLEYVDSLDEDKAWNLLYRTYRNNSEDS